MQRTVIISNRGGVGLVFNWIFIKYTFLTHFHLAFGCWLVGYITSVNAKKKIWPDKRHHPNSKLISPEAGPSEQPLITFEIIGHHQDIGNELPAFVITDELPELSYNVAEVATCCQKTSLVSSHNHVFNKKKTLKSGHIVWQCSIRIKICIVLPQ